MDRAKCTERLKVVNGAPNLGTPPARYGKRNAATPAAWAVAPVKVRPPADEAGLGLSEELAPLAAERPDAAPRRWDTVLRAVAHAIVLLSVVAFVLVYCVCAPVVGWLRGTAELATVEVVADAPAVVVAPEVRGILRAERPLPRGTMVRKGQLLGRIDSPRIDAEVECAAAELHRLQVQQLRSEQRAPRGGEDAEALAARVSASSDALECLHAIRRRLLVLAPVEGFLQQDLAGTTDVTPGARLAEVVPLSADLHLDVTAPLEVLNELQRRGVVVAEFATAGGSVKVSAVAVPGSVRPTVKANSGRRNEIWGTLRCTPVAVPVGAPAPGAIGRLCW